MTESCILMSGNSFLWGFIAVAVFGEPRCADAVENKVGFSGVRYPLRGARGDEDRVSLCYVGWFNSSDFDSAFAFYDEVNLIYSFQMVWQRRYSRFHSGTRNRHFL